MARGGDPTAAHGRRNIESVSLPDSLWLNGQTESRGIRLDRATSYQLFKLLDIRTDENGEYYSTGLKEGALEAAATAEGSERNTN